MTQKHISTSCITIRIIFAAMGNIYFGYSLAYYSITQSTIIIILGYAGEDYQVNLDGLINALLPVGGALGAFYSSYMTSKFGIRKCFLVCDLIGLIVACASLYLNFYTLTITRFLYGVIVGINSALDPQYIQQISPISLSGILGAFCNMFLMLGLTFAFILSWIFLQLDPIDYNTTVDYGLLGFNSWRILFGFPAITCILRFLAFTFIYTEDLPSELLQRGDRQKTQAALKTIYQDQFVWEQMKELEQNLQQQGQKEITYGDLVGKVYRRRLIIGSTLSLLNQWCGINAINFYSVVIFTQISNGNFTVINLLTVGFGLMGVLAAPASGLLVSRFGRRIIFLIGNAVCFVSLCALTGLYMVLSLQNSFDKDYLQILVVITVIIFYVAFSMSLGPVFWIYISEILPSKGIGLVVVQNWISLALLAQFFPIIADATQVYVCFGMFTIVSFLGEFFIFSQVLETKDFKKAQIYAMFSEQDYPEKGVTGPRGHSINEDTSDSLNDTLVSKNFLP